MTDTAQIAPRPFWFKLLFALSVLGPLLKDANTGGDTSIFFFAVNLILVWALCGFMWGIAGVLAVAYILVPTVFSIILGIMLFSGK
ncbi:MAG: hypothetical protein HWE08_14450 [Alphaproteobacteria bacterium]|nr:hypothetical protein [Alphaproteobacteria bacterium]